MVVPRPHFRLIPTAKSVKSNAAVATVAKEPPCGQWRFLLESEDGSTRFEAADRERGVEGQRLELLAVVRGLEALDQPSRVTMVTSSDYVRRGMRLGLTQWRENGFCWESYGRMVPVRNADLWRRLDRALQIHDVQCCTRRIDGPH